MKINRAVCIGLFVGLALAQAQEGPGPRQEGEGRFGRGPGRGGFRGPNLGFALLDANGDGTLSADEIAAAPAVLGKLGKNSDGQIGSAELRAAMEARRASGAPGFGPEGREGPEGRRRGPEGGASSNVVDDTVKTLMAFDANSDGKLSKSELPERMQGLFDRADENKDGVLTVDEIRKLAAAQAAPAQSAGPTGRGGPEGRREGFGQNMNFVRMDPVLAAIDTNGDGTISVEEIRNSPASIRKLDTDGDGKVTRDEVMAAIGRARESQDRRQ